MKETLGKLEKKIEEIKTLVNHQDFYFRDKIENRDVIRKLAELQRDIVHFLFAGTILDNRGDCTECGCNCFSLASRLTALELEEGAKTAELERALNEKTDIGNENVRRVNASLEKWNLGLEQFKDIKDRLAALEKAASRPRQTIFKKGRKKKGEK